MSSPCARCKKTVYPVEKFSCLDKIWHKGCFTCETCNLKLTMKTYKGYNKLPYCNTHYPTTKFTAIVDTPEALRLAKQQRNQSDVIYRKDKKESLKGFTSIADSVANLQATQASKLASSVGYQKPPPEIVKQPRSDPVPYQQSYDKAPSNHQAPSYEEPPLYDQAPSHDQPDEDPQVYDNPPPSEPPSATPTETPQYIALYEYTAGDDDEISFEEGDVIADATAIDDGWMEGRNIRTGCYGMFPSNYVELVS